MPVKIDELLRVAAAFGASDLHCKAGSQPFMRIGGELRPISTAPRLTQEDTLDMAFSMMSNRQKQRFKEVSEADIAYGVSGLGRFRANVFQQRGSVGMVLRVIPDKVRSITELGLPPVIERIAEEQRGLILVTGTTGSGKSTTLAAMIDHINNTRGGHIITIEDPIEFALPAAETGHLVLSPLHTLDAPETIRRIVPSFPPHLQKSVRLQLAGI